MNLDNAILLRDQAIKKLASQAMRPYGKSLLNKSRLPIGVGIRLEKPNEFKLSIHIPHETFRPEVQALEKIAQGEVVVTVTGEVKPYINSSVRVLDDSPLRIGSSIHHANDPMEQGKVGCFVRKFNQDNGVFLISCNHVIALCNNAAIGDNILSEGLHIADSDQFIHLIDCKYNETIADAALARVREPNKVFSLTELGNGISLVGHHKTEELVKPMDVLTVNGQQGIVTDFGFNALVPYRGLTSEFSNLIVVESNGDYSFGREGDSGSLIYDLGGYAVGILIAGNKPGTIIYASPISTILDTLNLELALN